MFLNKWEEKSGLLPAKVYRASATPRTSKWNKNKSNGKFILSNTRKWKITSPYLHKWITLSSTSRKYPLAYLTNFPPYAFCSWDLQSLQYNVLTCSLEILQHMLVESFIAHTSRLWYMNQKYDFSSKPELLGSVLPLFFTAEKKGRPPLRIWLHCPERLIWGGDTLKKTIPNRPYMRSFRFVLARLATPTAKSSLSGPTRVPWAQKLTLRNRWSESHVIWTVLCTSQHDHL